MTSRSQRGKTKYSESWRNSYPWVNFCDKDVYSAYCNLCRSTFSVASMGVQALKSHSEGKKHKQLVDAQKKSFGVQDFFTAKPSSSTTAKQNNKATESSAKPTNNSIQTDIPTSGHEVQTQISTSKVVTEERNLTSYLVKDEVTMNEAYWCIQAVMTHCSLRDAESDIHLMKIMAQDDKIQQMKLSKAKIAYTITYGIAPYFNSELLKKIKNCKHFVIAFDESLNKYAQAQQMDVLIRFWNSEENKVQSRYFTSVFLQHSTAEDLLEGIKKALQHVGLEKIIQVSMDGPNVNLKLLKLLKKELKSDDNDSELLDIGSCGIHVVHRAFKLGMKGTEWDVVQFLRAIYNLFKDSPSRRGDFVSITGISSFPQPFCDTRWVENVSVVQRASKLLIHLKKYVDKVGTDKKLLPKCNSFVLVKDALADNLLPAKLAFFETLASDLEPFLREFQSDSPLAPFLYSSLSQLTEALMARIVKKDVLNQKSLKNIDLDNPDNLLRSKDVDVGFGTRKALGACKDVSSKEALQFRLQCSKAIKLVIKKIMERSPLKFPLTKALSCLDPDTLLDDSKGVGFLKDALDTLVQSNLLVPSSAENVSREYLLLKKSRKVEETLDKYERGKTRLDEFWIKLLEPKDCYSNLRDLVQLLLILSHGNASVERGFSVNKECIVENQLQVSLIAQRQIFDAVTHLNGVCNLPFSKPLIISVRNAHSRYTQALDEQRKVKENERKKQEEKRQIAKEIRMLEQQKKILDENRNKVVEDIEKKKNTMRM